MIESAVFQYPVTLPEISGADAVARRHELEADGLVLNCDFIWQFFPRVDSMWSHQDVRPSKAEFYFATASLATFYQLKWCTQ